VLYLSLAEAVFFVTMEEDRDGRAGERAWLGQVGLGQGFSGVGETFSFTYFRPCTLRERLTGRHPI
jgi:hypothetical protein